MHVHLVFLVVVDLLHKLGVSEASCTMGPIVSEKTNNVDSSYVTQYIVTSSSLTSSCCGVLSEVQIYPKRTGYIQFQIWRPLVTNEYMLVGEFRHLVSSIDVNDTVAISNEISVQVGDSIGWYSEAFDIIPYTTGSNEGDGTLVVPLSADHLVGYNYTVGVAYTDDRTYAIQYTVSDGDAPVFTNLPATIDVYDHTAINTSIFYVSINDSNAAELSSLVMSVSFYEPHSSTPAIAIDLSTGHVTTANQLYVSTVTLTLTLTDVCGLSDSQTLTVNIINQPPIISNLPAAVDLAETVTVETLLYTLSVSDLSNDLVTCTINSSSPTDAPFLVQHIPGTSDYGVYTRVMPLFDYTTTDQYVLTIHCTDTKDTTSGQFQVNMLPNTVPFFLNLPASVTIATTTPIGTVVYTVLAADNETTDIEFSINSCPRCWFEIADTGQVILAKSILSTSRTLYEIEITVSDGSLISSSTTLSFLISDVNNQPTINNLPLTLSALETVAIGTAIFTLDVTEHDTEDTLNYVISYTPSSAAAKFRFDTSTKQLVLIQSLDFESGVIQYTIGFTVDDGLLSTGLLSLTIDVLDDNEAPVFANEMHYITDYEARNIGYSLPSASFTVTDADAGDSLTYSIASGDPLERFTINATSGILQTAVEYDIDDGRMPAVVNLTIMITDTGGLTGTTIVQVTLQDRNDNQPIFISDTFEANIPNDYPVKSSIVAVSATDIDYFYNEIQYSVVDGDVQYFDVNEEAWVYLIKSVAEFYNYTTLSVKIEALSNGHRSYTYAYILVSPALGDSLFNHTGNILWFTACVVAMAFIVIMCVFMAYRYIRYGYACSPKKWSFNCGVIRRSWQTLKNKMNEGTNSFCIKWKAWKIPTNCMKKNSSPKKVSFLPEKTNIPKESPPRSQGGCCKVIYRKLLSWLPNCKRPVERIQVKHVAVTPDLPTPLTNTYKWTPWKNEWDIGPNFAV